VTPPAGSLLVGCWRDVIYDSKIFAEIVIYSFQPEIQYKLSPPLFAYKTLYIDIFVIIYHTGCVDS
jgi:hypothetical protein